MQMENNFKTLADYVHDLTEEISLKIVELAEECSTEIEVVEMAFDLTKHWDFTQAEREIRVNYLGCYSDIEDFVKESIEELNQDNTISRYFDYTSYIYDLNREGFNFYNYNNQIYIWGNN